MTPLRFLPSCSQLLSVPLVLELLLASVASAQSDSTKVWATVAVINNGDITPTIWNLESILTPLGAQQMLQLGSAFRSRYIVQEDGNGNSTSTNSSSTAFIQGISVDAIDNGQLAIFSLPDESTVAGAISFFQSLYPPAPDAFSSQVGGPDVANDFLLGNANKTTYPFGGYQYPHIQSLGVDDPSSVLLDATPGCGGWDDVAGASEVHLDERTNETQAFYNSVFDSPVLKGTLNPDLIQYQVGWPLFEFVRYMYMHNETVFKGLESANDTLNTMEKYAFQSIKDVSVINETDSTKAQTIVPLAGRTLAQSVINAFTTKVQGKADQKLTLMFSYHQPMISFFSLVGLYSQANAASGPFSTLPQRGASMVFELIGEDADGSGNMPSADKLSIRFLYRASTDEDDTFVTYPLFSSGFDGETIPYTGFIDKMSAIAVDQFEWCDLCDATQAAWCQGRSSSGKHKMKPAIAGVIGAMVTLAVTGIIGFALFALGLVHVGRAREQREPSPSSGGFKGVEKGSSDADVTVTKAGIQHERIGSWELKGGNKDQDLSTIPRHFDDDDDDQLSLTGHRPVKAVEGF